MDWYGCPASAGIAQAVAAAHPSALNIKSKPFPVCVILSNVNTDGWV
jgi:hypothetical protein